MRVTAKNFAFFRKVYWKLDWDFVSNEAKIKACKLFVLNMKMIHQLNTNKI